MSVAKAKARSILQELGIESPQLLRQIKEICVARGAYVKEDQIDGAEARLVVRGKTGIITVRPNDSYESRTRFSIAHELGHFELHRDDNSISECNFRVLNDWFARQGAEQKEIQANEFAAESLMPESFVSKEIANQKPSLNLIEHVAEVFQTSMMASAIKYIETTEEACALVLFAEGNSKYVWRSRFLEKQNYWVKLGKLDGYSYASDASKGEKIPDRMSTVDAEVWLDVPEWLREESIFEQTRYFSKLDFGLSLIWINDPKFIRS